VEDTTFSLEESRAQTSSQEIVSALDNPNIRVLEGGCLARDSILTAHNRPSVKAAKMISVTLLYTLTFFNFHLRGVEGVLVEGVRVEALVDLEVVAVVLDSYDNG